MDTTLSAIRTFRLTVEQGNFTLAARVLGVTPQAASRAVARLEEELGVALFRRNTRHVEPTDAGRLYYAACTQALDALAEAERTMRRRRSDPAGLVRVSVPTTYGHHRFMPMLGDFCRAYPQVEVDVEISNRNVDFVRERFDLAVRMGSLGDASFVARKLGDFTLGVFASPAYLQANGTPRVVADLEGHTCAVFVMPSTGRGLPWAFLPGPQEVHPRASVRIRDDVLGLISFARAGGGLIQLYHYLVEAELTRGELVEVLAPLTGYTRPFSLIYPREALSRPAVRALVDFVVARAE
ncbi:MAG: LysR family transcriptional regulator [Alphaproteobacteria bacterium]|nr:LysR family transcriptional regulator [Alphaproteobacteria bacterium]